MNHSIGNLVIFFSSDEKQITILSSLFFEFSNFSFNLIICFYLIIYNFKFYSLNAQDFFENSIFKEHKHKMNTNKNEIKNNKSKEEKIKEEFDK